MRVLAVNDNPPTVGLIKRYLTPLGYEVETAGDGAEALAKIELSMPDVLLCDCMMPVMHGWDLVKILRADARFSGLKIIFMPYGKELWSDQTKYIAELWRDIAVWNVDGFVTQPFNPAEIVRVITLVTQRD